MVIQRSMARPIRVAHVCQQLNTGGMEHLLAEFARKGNRDLVNPFFIALAARGAVADDIEACGCEVAALDEMPGLRPKIAYRLARLFRKWRIDIVHTHNTKPLLYAGPAARLAGVRGVIHTRHGCRYGSTARQNLLFALAAHCADQVICVSDDSARLSRRDGIDPRIVKTIPNGVDLDRFAFRGPDPTGPALFAGRLAPEKDVATLLLAARHVATVRPQFRLAIAGSGPSETELKELAIKLRIEDRVEFLGEVRDMPAQLSRASLFVLPSVTEGLPLTVLEAMACGLPVVATSVGGTPEAVDNDVSGLLVPSGDAAAMANALLRLHCDPDLARGMGLAGRRRADALFDVRSMVLNYECEYLRVLESRGLDVAA